MALARSASPRRSSTSHPLSRRALSLSTRWLRSRDHHSFRSVSGESSPIASRVATTASVGSRCTHRPSRTSSQIQVAHASRSSTILMRRGQARMSVRSACRSASSTRPHSGQRMQPPPSARSPVRSYPHPRPRRDPKPSTTSQARGYR
ncbi:MAG: hypothetical protein DYG94_07985 [Leptolyngbya sp. PLA3]|nr:MAG: hypothetical protein EDM82_09575 [Cyanobacteria bacterium CYA]MCE7968671.1 hypothetical protein [Leptolyngbya sp. PL-A3]